MGLPLEKLVKIVRGVREWERVYPNIEEGTYRNKIHESESYIKKDLQGYSGSTDGLDVFVSFERIKGIYGIRIMRGDRSIGDESGEGKRLQEIYDEVREEYHRQCGDPVNRRLEEKKREKIIRILGLSS